MGVRVLGYLYTREKLNSVILPFLLQRYETLSRAVKEEHKQHFRANGESNTEGTKMYTHFSRDMFNADPLALLLLDCSAELRNICRLKVSICNTCPSSTCVTDIPFCV